MLIVNWFFNCSSKFAKVFIVSSMYVSTLKISTFFVWPALREAGAEFFEREFWFSVINPVFLNFQFQLRDVISLYQDQAGSVMNFVIVILNFSRVVPISLFWMFFQPNVAFLITP